MALSASQPVRTNFRTILPVIATQLQTNLPGGFSLDASGIFLSLRSSSVPHFLAEHDIILRPLGFVTDLQRDYAGGRITLYLSRQLQVICRSRATLDESFKDNAWLLGDGNLVLGHLALEDAVIDCLHEFFPTDASGNELTTEPIKVTTGTEANKDGRDQQAWGFSGLAFSVKYLAAVNQANQ